MNEVHDRIEVVQEMARRALVKFKHEQDPEDAALIEKMALCVFLKGSHTEKFILRMI